MIPIKKLFNSSNSDRAGPTPPRPTARRTLIGPQLPPGMTLESLALENKPAPTMQQQSTTSTPTIPRPVATPSPVAASSSSSTTQSLAMAPIYHRPITSVLPPSPQETKLIQILIFSQDEINSAQQDIRDKALITEIQVEATSETPIGNFKRQISRSFAIDEHKLKIQFPNGAEIPDDYTPRLMAIAMGTDLLKFPKPRLHALVPPAAAKEIRVYLGIALPINQISDATPTPSVSIPIPVAASSSTVAPSLAIAPRTLPSSLQDAKQVTVRLFRKEHGLALRTYRKALVESKATHQAIAESLKPYVLKETQIWATGATTAECYKKEILQRSGIAESKLEIQFNNWDEIQNEHTPADAGTDIFDFPEPLLHALVPEVDVMNITASSASPTGLKPYSIYDSALVNDIEPYVNDSVDISEKLHRLQQLENLLASNSPPTDTDLLPCYQVINCSTQHATASDPWRIYGIRRHISPTDILAHSHEWTKQYIANQRQQLAYPSSTSLVESKELKSTALEVNWIMRLPRALQESLQGHFDDDTDPGDAQQKLIRLETALRWAEKANRDNADYSNQCEDKSMAKIYSLLNLKEIQQNAGKFIQQMQKKFLKPSSVLGGNNELNKALFIKAIVDYLRNDQTIKISIPKVTSDRGELRLTIKATNPKKIGHIVKAIYAGLLPHLVDNFLSPGFGFNYLHHFGEMSPGLITSGDIVLLQTPNSKNSSILEARLFVNVNGCLSKAVKMMTPAVEAAAPVPATGLPLSPPGGLGITDSSSAAVFSHGGSQAALFYQNSNVTTTTTVPSQHNTSVVSRNQRS